MEEKRRWREAESGGSTEGKGKKPVPGDDGEVGMQPPLASAKLVPGRGLWTSAKAQSWKPL